MRELILKIIFIWVFVIGGTAQLFGLISNTKSTIFLSSFIFCYLFLIVIRRFKIKIGFIELLYFIFILSIVASGYFNNIPFYRVISYFIYPLVTYSVYLFMKNSINKDNICHIMKFFLIISFLQLPLVFIQKLTSEKISSLSGGQVGAHDVAFGSFYLASDISLCFFLLAFLIYIFFEETACYFFKNTAIRYACIISIIFTIFLTNSKISHFILLLILCYYPLSKKFCQKRILLLGLVSLIFLGSLGVIESKVDYLDDLYGRLNISSGDIDMEVGNYSTPKNVPRWGPVLIFLTSDFKIFGDGPFDFYDPISKEWKYGGGHSQIYWLYNDIGFLGLLCSFFPIFFISYQKKKYVKKNFLFFLLYLAASIVTTTMSDFAINISYNFFLLAPTLLKGEYRV